MPLGTYINLNESDIEHISLWAQLLPLPLEVLTRAWFQSYRNPMIFPLVKGVQDIWALWRKKLKFNLGFLDTCLLWNWFNESRNFFKRVLYKSPLDHSCHLLFKQELGVQDPLIANQSQRHEMKNLQDWVIQVPTLLSLVRIEPELFLVSSEFIQSDGGFERPQWLSNNILGLLADAKP